MNLSEPSDAQYQMTQTSSIASSCQGCQIDIQSRLSDCSTSIDSCVKEKKLAELEKGTQIKLSPNFPIFCVSRGTVLGYFSARAGKDVALLSFNSGEMIGISEFFRNSQYTVEYRCAEKTVGCYLAGTDWSSLLEHQAFRHKPAELLVDHIEKLEKQLFNRMVLPASALVANCILNFHDKQNMRVLLSRTEMTAVTGLTMETVIRILSQMKKNNVIRISGKAIFILSLAELKNAC